MAGSVPDLPESPQPKNSTALVLYSPLSPEEALIGSEVTETHSQLARLNPFSGFVGYPNSAQNDLEEMVKVNALTHSLKQGESDRDEFLSAFDHKKLLSKLGINAYNDLVSHDRHDLVVDESVNSPLNLHAVAASSNTSQRDVVIHDKSLPRHLSIYKHMIPQSLALLRHVNLSPEFQFGLKQDLHDTSIMRHISSLGYGPNNASSPKVHDQEIYPVSIPTENGQADINHGQALGSRSRFSSMNTSRLQAGIDRTKLDPHHINDKSTSTNVPSSHESTVALVQTAIRPTMALSNYVGDHANIYGRGEMNLPDHLNCALWIVGIPLTIPKAHLYRELFKVISTGSIVGVHINNAGQRRRNYASKVVFKHALHAARLVEISKTIGISMNGRYLRVKYNKYGHREYPRRYHYKSRVVIVEVLNDPSMGIQYWLRFLATLSAHVIDIESTRHLFSSTPKHMVMEFRFAGIFRQSRLLYQGIKRSPAFKGKVTVRYIPDIVCDHRFGISHA